jgi:hypothetical protein
MGQFFCRVFVGLVALMAVPFAFGQVDIEKSKDYPGISRMPNYYIAEYKETAFDSYSFTVTEGGKEKERPVEGRRTISDTTLGTASRNPANFRSCATIRTPRVPRAGRCCSILPKPLRSV